MAVLKVRIGARASRLSRAQASLVSSLISERVEDVALEFVPVKTLGDRLPPAEERKKLGRAGEKGAFTGDLEALLLQGKIDIAVHSMKDLPSEETEGLMIGATPPRSDPRDVLVSKGEGVRSLPRGARIGTSSLRRKAQLLKLRPDLDVVELHGNVDTRLRMVAEGLDGLRGVVLAAAGLQRLGEAARISQTFSIAQMVPAVGQGIIAVQIREDDRELETLLSRITDVSAATESLCERAFARRLGVDCNVPVGGCAKASGGKVKIVGVIARPDGGDYRKDSEEGPKGSASDVGRRLAERLIENGPQRRDLDP